MKLGRLYTLILMFGKGADPRRNKKKIRGFSDTAVLFGSPGTEIKKILVGIDIDVSEILLADRIRSREGLDAVLAHHPGGGAYAALHEVMSLQIDLLSGAGVPRRVAEELLEERKREVERKILPVNHMRSADAARLLNIPFMCAHTPADNHVHDFILKFLLRKKPSTVGRIVSVLNEIPEYREAVRYNAGPRVVLGSPHRSPGKIFAEMTGGTEGPKDMYSRLYKNGVRTIVSMHMGEENLKKARATGLNVVIAGHISSDTLGLNLLLDKIEKEEKLDIICCSGFRRFRRPE